MEESSTYIILLVINTFLYCICFYLIYKKRRYTCITVRSPALLFFNNEHSIRNILKTLCDVGLGYLPIGQSSPTLSGGEAQRVKLATELARRDTGKTMYILDEPTTGLHVADVERLLCILQRLCSNGSSVLVIEHNLDVIKTADYIIDLGPEGGARGGNILACGTPEEVCQVESSYTGQYLRTLL